MARQDKSTALYLIAELERNDGSVGSVEVLALLEYLETLAKLRFGSQTKVSRMCSHFDPGSVDSIGLDQGDAQSIPPSRPRPVRSAAPYPWDDMSNQGE